jgi:hypothetical protein
MSASQQKGDGRLPLTGNQDDDVQKMAEIKEYLEAKISDLESELAKLKNMLLLVDSSLRERSFVPAIALRSSSANPTSVRTEAQKAVATIGSQSKSPSSNLDSSKANASQQRTTPEILSERQLRRTKDSMVLANALIDQNKVVIVPSQDVKLSEHTPPFESFFVNRILRGYQSKDEEESKNGKLKPSEVLQFNVQETQGNISSVTVSNYRDSNRLNEILSTITWAFTRMLEKK